MKKSCPHTMVTHGEDGTSEIVSAWRDTGLEAARGAIYEKCACCQKTRYKAGQEPKKKRVRKPKHDQAQLITLPPPSPETVTLPDGINVIHGACGDVLATFEDNSYDAIVTDPPSGIAFMEKAWDRDLGGRDEWIAQRAQEFAQALRVLKPGAYALVWALPRTSHWTTTALENAGFEIRDVVHHIFGSGFPKSMDLSAEIDKKLGAEREVIGEWHMPGRNKRQNYHFAQESGVITAPESDEAKEFDGYGTALKPAVEHWILAQKPRSGTFAENVLEWRTGGLNVKAAAVATETDLSRLNHVDDGMFGVGNGPSKQYGKPIDQQGRHPAHLVLSHTLFCQRVGTKRVQVQPGSGSTGGYHGVPSSAIARNDEGDGMETVDAWECAPGCPVAELASQGGYSQSSKMKPGAQRKNSLNKGGYHGAFGPTMSKKGTPGDAGTVDRYFTQLDADPFAVAFHYFGKPSKREREAGLADMRTVTAAEMTGREDQSLGLDNPRAGKRGDSKNFHPTVKSIELMKWLLTLAMPPKAPGYTPRVLDMFAGSGTTGVAALALGYNATLIEADFENEGYINLIYGRLDAARHKARKGKAA